MAIAFLDCELDLDRQELRRGGEDVAIEPQVFAVLAYLAENRDRVVSKAELLDNVWGDRFVSESALTSRISTARQAVGDDGRAQRVVKTIHGRGFRFVADTHDQTAAIEQQTADTEPLDRVQALETGKGFAVAVYGPRGSGKTDLLERSVHVARRNGIAAGLGSSSMQRARPYAGLVSVIEQLVQLRPDLLTAIPASCAAELTACFEGAMPTSEARLGLALRELIVAAAGQPLLMAVDDLDYANDGSVRLLANIARFTRDQPIGLVVACESVARLGSEFSRYERTGEPRLGPAPPKFLTEPLSRLAVIGARFDRLVVEAATGKQGDDLDRLLDEAVAAAFLEEVDDEHRFADPGTAEQLVTALSQAAARRIRTETAAKLVDLGSAPERVARLLIDANEQAAASPHALKAASAALDRFAYLDVQQWVDDTIDHAPPDVAFGLRLAEADALAGAGDPRSVAAYRRAIELCPEPMLNVLRAKLARASLLSGDVAGAEEAIATVEPDGGPADAPIHLVRGMLAYYQADFATAEQHADRATAAAMEPGSAMSLVDAISFRGMVSHVNGEWFDRLHRELRSNRDGGEHLASFFDAHLCVAEYMLYGPMPYDEVIEMATDLRVAADRAGATMASAFATAIIGEAALLAGDLDGAREPLESSLEMHHELGAATGEAHTLQRLAELEIALGNPREARKLGRRALAVARWSPMAHHLVQRAYGTILAASTDQEDALATATEALASIDGTTTCPPCDVMIYVPLASAFAENGQIDQAKSALQKARISAAFWQGTAWPAAIAEASSCISTGAGDEAEAIRHMASAVELFEEAGQVLDAERCREALHQLTEA